MTKLFSLFCLMLCAAHLWAENAEEQQTLRKTLLVLSSTGGGGHTAATNTLQKLVGEEYDIKIVYPINQLRIYGIPSCEQIYNSMLRNGWVRSMNFMVRHLAPTIFGSRMGKLEKIITSYVNAHQPDLVISVIPFVNYPASEAARKQDIPFLMITTDNDLRNWVMGMEKVRHPQFKVTIGEDLVTTRDVLTKKNIPESAIETIGLPLRPDFIGQKDRQKILQELCLPDNKETILIMMGAAGGDTAYDYAKKIGTMDLGVHLMIIAGRNNTLKKDLERLELHPSNTLTAFGYTDRVSDLMAVSNLVITKPGPGTINEAMAMKLPILIDNTASSLFWERANVDIVLKYGVGQKIKKFGEIKSLLMTYLKDPQAIENTEQSFEGIPANQFHLRIRQIIHEMISVSIDCLESTSF